MWQPPLEFGSKEACVHTGYEARRAERRYKAVDPDNRVVARTLEREWEQRLRDLGFQACTTHAECGYPTTGMACLVSEGVCLPERLPRRSVQRKQPV